MTTELFKRNAPGSLATVEALADGIRLTYWIEDAYDWFDFTPAEARQLATLLVAAADHIDPPTHEN